MQEKYAPTELEPQAQAHWRSTDAYRVVEHDPRFRKGKFYACSMLPYPSGKLHMGHVRNYTINDMMARQLRMAGYNVLMPMGWDAFGLPAENAAIKNKVAPAAWTYYNIATMKAQMQAMGLAIDWSREVAACDPAYYKWNQWLFLKMLESGVAYRKTQVVNWDPVDHTVLANEQVIDGKGWRTGAVVEKREIPGYYLAITKYADELLTHTENHLDGWPERVRIMQANWIGKSVGVRFAFPHAIHDAQGALIQAGKLFVFTTRADTIMGVTFVAVAPEHPLAAHAASKDPAVAAFIEKAKQGSVMEADMATMEKEGVPTGLQVTHPITGEQVPVWVGNYVLMSYGDGAVMGVPGHDERDLAFANKYRLPIRQVVEIEAALRKPAEQEFDATRWQEWYADKERGVCITSGELNGLGYKAAVEAVAAALEAKQLGEKKTQWRLRDWGISRQRYWGTPIPMINCTDCGPVPVPYDDLPVRLPEDLVPDGSGNPLTKHTAFLNCHCPKCGKPAQRETDTMDTFVDSSWYFMRYCSPDNAQAMVDERTNYWMPMDQYIGGIEHAILHLLYARFWSKVMRDMGLVKFDEPFTKLLCQGMVLNHIYQRKNEKGGIDYFWPDEVENIYGEDGRISGAKRKSDGLLIDYDGVGTMSKSKNNGVDPQSLIDRYGADTARLFVMFASPPEQTLEWSDAGVDGAHRFLRRVWAFGWSHQTTLRAGQALVPSIPLSPIAAKLRLEIHSILKQADYDYQRMQYNTVVSAAMKMLNALESASGNDKSIDAVRSEGFGILLRVLYPVVPHITFRLWEELGLSSTMGDLLDAPWPQVDPKALIQDTIELMLQINGKLRGSLIVSAQADKAAIEAQALAHESVVRMAAGAAPKKIVVVPGRLVNVVL